MRVRVPMQGTGAEQLVVAMKVFQLINSSGVMLNEIEVMASWPEWGAKMIYDKNNPPPTDIEEANKELYQETKSMELKENEYKKVSKWDIAATLVDRLNHDLIWGDK